MCMENLQNCSWRILHGMTTSYNEIVYIRIIRSSLMNASLYWLKVVEKIQPVETMVQCGRTDTNVKSMSDVQGYQGDSPPASSTEVSKTMRA